MPPRLVTEPPRHRAAARREAQEARPLVEHVADVGGQRHEAQQVIGEQPLACLRIGIGEGPGGRGEPDVALLDLGEAQELQRLGIGEELVDLELQAAGELRQVGTPVIGRGSQRLDQAGHQVGADPRQPLFTAF